MRSYVNYSIIRKCLYFVDFTTFQILGQKFVKFFFGILVQMMTPKGNFEINWTLMSAAVLQILNIKGMQWPEMEVLYRKIHSKGSYFW